MAAGHADRSRACVGGFIESAPDGPAQRRRRQHESDRRPLMQREVISGKGSTLSSVPKESDTRRRDAAITSGFNLITRLQYVG